MPKTTRSKGAVLLAGLGLTNAAIGARIGVSTQVAGMWRTGARLPGIPNGNRQALFAAFGIPIESWDEPAIGPGLHKASPRSNVLQFPAARPVSPVAAPVATLTPEVRVGDEPDEPEPPVDRWGARVTDAHAQSLHDALESLMMRVKFDGEGRTAIAQAKLIASASQTLASLKKMRGEISSEVNVLRHPKYQAIKQAFVDFIEARAPELMSDLADAIESVEQKSA